VVIDRGRVIARGTADDLKDQVGGQRLELTVRDAIDLVEAARRLRPLGVDEPRLDESTRRLSLPVSGGTDTLAEALRVLAGSGVEVLDVGLRRPDLDDVFLTLTGHHAEDGESDEPAGDRTPVGAGEGAA
jgi:ABC-2 type transport system ATP-binding protein